MTMPVAPQALDVREMDRRQAGRPRILGHVVSIDSMHATIAVSVDALAGNEQWAVGQIISIRQGESRVVAVVSDLRASEDSWHTGRQNLTLVKVELIGAITEAQPNQLRFKRGIQDYPNLGAEAHRIRSADLAAIYAFTGAQGIQIGAVSQDVSIPAVIDAKELVSRHFAIVGSTGVGKTTSTCTLLKDCLAARPGLRVLILDPHNEFEEQFGSSSVVFDAETLELPFWLFRFEELADIVFNGRTPSSEETDILFEMIKAAKVRFVSSSSANPLAALSQKPMLARAGASQPVETSGISADTPVPYRLSDALKVLDGWMGKLERDYSVFNLRSLRNRLEALAHDPRYRFMFGRGFVEDNLSQIIGKIFRVPDEGRRVTIVQLGGLPNEVVNAVVSVLARLAFDVAVHAGPGYEISVVCEEAHRYIPADQSLGFGPTRRAIGRIAKEGRKYGASLGVVTQRPSELDRTVLSQCSTMFAMRLLAEVDKNVIRSALAESASSMISFISSLSDGEAIAFGEGVATPMRMKFRAPVPVAAPAAGVVEDRTRVAIAASIVHGMRGGVSLEAMASATTTQAVEPPPAAAGSTRW